jgi:preprotein translocase subunit SecE
MPRGGGGDIPEAEVRRTIPMEEKTAKTRTSPGEFMRQVQAEGRKIIWPTRQETVTTSIFVGIMMVILAFFFLGIDTVFGKLVQFLLSLA